MNETNPKYTNALAQEKSPYLLQHAHNPVNWMPWSEEAFKKAADEDKPVFLSIGYSTCHWCHVMEHESFENEEIAQMMNDTFVCVKVDREERPDIDHVYMAVTQMMTGHGGWPMTVVMTPDKKPFFAGTYFPPRARFGRSGMFELIPKIAEVWKTQRKKISESAEEITSHLKKTMDGVSAGMALGEESLKSAFDVLSKNFDGERGGFGQKPKFPTPHVFLFLLRYWKRSGDITAIAMVEKTLQEMRRGGIYDHIGFGFHRYSTDRNWLLPHFEKMLYDQAMLALSYIELYQATHNEDYAQTAREIFTYVLRDMTSPDGGFYSAEDADSEGEEGKFYVWTEAELREILGDSDAEFLKEVFATQPDGNFTEEATGHKTGANILHLAETLEANAIKLNLNKDDLKAKIEELRKELFFKRNKRIHPYKDDKILTDWNGLMMVAFARGARVLGNEEYAVAAQKSFEFIKANLFKNGRLLHRFRDGEATIGGNVDDYAFLIWGLLELYGTTFDIEFLKTAIELNLTMLEHFWDEDTGGLFFTAKDAETLLVRKKEIYDGAVPSGNSVAMLNLLKLAKITGNAELLKKAEQINQAFSPQISRSPSAYTQFLVALDFAVGPSSEIVVVGKETETQEFLKELNKMYLPNAVTLLKTENSGIEEIAEFTKNQMAIAGKASVYICENYACNQPVSSVQEMMELLG
ncbi:MAG TPA: thioredoxin domain-containing protein [Patescibacteria group bacterium]|nr:thioredoxin domain-containing protein [Patescibacteria group bacterium]